MPVKTYQDDCFGIADRPAPAPCAVPLHSCPLSSGTSDAFSPASHCAPDGVCELQIIREPHILVVDDDVLIGLALRVVLQGCGFRVTLARDGMEALDIEDADPADAVLTDVNMPKMNGISLTLALHHKRPELPIVILSSSAHEQVVCPVRQQVFAVLSKPAIATEIRTTLQRALNCHGEHAAGLSLSPTLSR